MDYAKKGLRLLSASIIINMLWLIISTTVNAFSENLPQIVAGILLSGLITAIIRFICYILDMVGLSKAGKANKRFRLASRLKIISLILTFVCIALSAIAVIIITKKERMSDNAQTLIMIVHFVELIMAISEIVVFAAIIKGCKEIAPRSKTLANVTYGMYIATLLLSVAVGLIVTFKADLLSKIFFAISASTVIDIFATAYAILFVILIFKATRTANKPIKRK